MTSFQNSLFILNLVHFNYSQKPVRHLRLFHVKVLTSIKVCVLLTSLFELAFFIAYLVHFIRLYFKSVIKVLVITFKMFNMTFCKF